jgi:hypothetical protein
LFLLFIHCSLITIIISFSFSLFSYNLLQGSQEEWIAVFAIVAVLNVVGAVIFCLFGSGDVQPWAEPPELISVPKPTINSTDNFSTMSDFDSGAFTSNVQSESDDADKDCRSGVCGDVNKDSVLDINGSESTLHTTDSLYSSQHSLDSGCPQTKGENKNFVRRYNSFDCSSAKDSSDPSKYVSTT